MRTVLGVVSISLLMALPHVQAQKRIDLDDVAIKGELMNDGRLRVRAREPAAIEDRVKYRTHYRNEIIESGELNGSAMSAAGRQPAAFSGIGAAKKKPAADESAAKKIESSAAGKSRR